MKQVATTKMSSKGQVVIPESIREELGLKPGAQFVVIGEKDVVIFKSIMPPSIDDFDSLIKKIRNQVKKAGFKKADLETIINEVRSSK